MEANSTKHPALHPQEMGSKSWEGQGRVTVRVLCALLTCLSWIVDGFICLNEGSCGSPADQDLFLFTCTEVVAIRDVQVHSGHLLAACRSGHLGDKRGEPLG